MLNEPDHVELKRFVLSHAYEGIIPVGTVATALSGAVSLAGDSGELTAAEKEAAIYDGDAPCLGGTVHGITRPFARPFFP